MECEDGGAQGSQTQGARMTSLEPNWEEKGEKSRDPEGPMDESKLRESQGVG